jgi:signal transduction histidine kinase
MPQDTLVYASDSAGVAPLDGCGAREREILDHINRKVAAAESLESLIDFLFEAVQPIFDCDRIGVSFVEEDGARLVAHHARASYVPVLIKKGYAEELAGSSLEQVIASGQPRIIGDLSAYLAQHPSSRSTAVLVGEGVRSNMTCPLRVEGRVVGVLFFSSRRPFAYEPRHVALHLAIAERLGQAVEKTRRIEELAEANRAYFEMLGFVSHELKSPLSSIVMDATVLSGGYVGDLTDSQKAVVAKIVSKADYLLTLVREYLDLARMEGGALALHPRDSVDLAADVAEPACDIVKTLAEARRITIEREYAPEPVRLACDPDLLKIVAVNLVGNAIKYGRDDGTVRVTVAPDEGGALLSVWNEGPGFPAAQRTRLFRKFSRLDTPELRKRKGTGVGLYTSWRIVKLHGGRIEAASEEGEWARFSVRLPLAPPSSS